MNSKKITAISANTNPKRFIQATHKRIDGTFTAELTDDPNQAKDFGERSKEMISKIFNPYSRVFKPEKITVTRSEVVAEMEGELR